MVECPQEWARNQVDACVLRLMNESEENHSPLTNPQARAMAEWGCPKCRQQYPASEVPRTYTCFCGKVEDPEWCVAILHMWGRKGAHGKMGMLFHLQAAVLCQKDLLHVHLLLCKVEDPEWCVAV